MRLVPKRQTVLHRHGFTESQSRVYLALLEHPTMSVGALSKVTNVPRSHLYKVLGDLHARGLVDILAAAGTREYRARPFAEFLKLRSAELRERLDEVAVDIETLGPIMQPPEREAAPEAADAAARVVMGRRAVAREIDDLLSGARRSVHFTSTEGAAGRLARHAGPCAAAWRSKKVAVTLVLPPRRASSIEWERLVADGSVDVLWASASPTAFVVCVDGERMILVHPSPDSDEQRIGKDFGVMVANAAIARTLVATTLAAASPTSPG